MIEGIVPLSKIYDVDKLYEALYKNDHRFKDFPFDRQRYTARIRTLQSTVEHMQLAAQTDEAALAHDRRLHPIPTHGHNGLVLWNNHKADAQLIEDMKNGLHQALTPKQLFRLNPIYQEFGLKRLTQRIDQKREANKPFGCTPGQAEERRRKRNDGKIRNNPELIGDNVAVYGNQPPGPKESAKQRFDRQVESEGLVLYSKLRKANNHEDLKRELVFRGCAAEVVDGWNFTERKTKLKVLEMNRRHQEKIAERAFQPLFREN